MNLNDKVAALDLARGYAIFLVVWMHCLQYCAGMTFTNPLYAFIYAFHMPLFLIISGYLYFNKLKKREPRVNLTRRAKQLLLPNLLWGGALAILTNNFGVNGILNSFWFLYTLFAVSVIYEIAYVLIRNIGVCTLIVSLLVLVLPGFEYVKFSTPFFGIGLWFGRFKLNELKINNLYIGLSAIAGLLLYYFAWQGDEYIYITRTPGLSNLGINEIRAYFIRIIVGTALSIIVILIFHKYHKYTDFKLIRRFSNSSLGIYVIHLFSLILFISFFDSFQEIFLRYFISVSEIVTLFVAFLYILATTYLIEHIHKTKYLTNII